MALTSRDDRPVARRSRLPNIPDMGGVGLGRRAALAGSVAATFTLLVAAPSQAHQAAHVIVEAPATGARVPADTDVRLYAAGELDRIEFTVRLDDRLIPGVPDPVHAKTGSRIRIPLRGMSEGRHALTLSYRPDSDEQPRRIHIEFTVGSSTWGPPAGLVSLGVVLVGLALLVKRRRTAGR